MNCARCGKPTSGTYNEGGLLTAVCSDCDAIDQRQKERRDFERYVQAHECDMCGAEIDEPGRFCSEECAAEYRYQNRTCDTCGGEFWDGGTSCTCEDDYDDDDLDDDDIFGYECLGCGHVQDHPGECDMCTGSAVDPMYS